MKLKEIKKRQKEVEDFMTVKTIIKHKDSEVDKRLYLEINIGVFGQSLIKIHRNRLFSDEGDSLTIAEEEMEPLARKLLELSGAK